MINDLLLPEATFGPTHHVEIAPDPDDDDDDEMMPDDCQWIKDVTATFGYNPNRLRDDPDCNGTNNA